MPTRSIHFRLTLYSVTLILSTTVCTICAAIYLESAQTKNAHQNRIERATANYLAQLHDELESYEKNWLEFTNDPVRRSHFSLPILRAPFITNIPKHITDFSEKNQLDKAIFYFSGFSADRDTLVAYYQRAYNGTVLLIPDSDEQLLFIHKDAGRFQQKSYYETLEVPRMSDTEKIQHKLLVINGSLSMHSNFPYISQTISSPQDIDTNNEKLGILSAYKSMDALRLKIEIEYDVTISLIDMTGNSDQEWEFPKNFNAKESNFETFITRGKGNQVYSSIIIPIEYNRQKLGYLIASIPRTEFSDHILTATGLILGIGAAISALSLCFSWLYLRRAFQPFTEMASAINYESSADKPNISKLSKRLKLLSPKSKIRKIYEFNQLYEASVQFLKIIQTQNNWLESNLQTIEIKNKELEALNKYKDQFLANTTHELKTPLHGIIGMANVIATSEEHSETTKLQLKTLINNGNRLDILLDDILDLNQIRNQGIKLNLEPVTISKVTESVIALSQYLVGDKNIQLLNDTPKNLPRVLADPNKLHQILYNLVGNALKFTEEGSVRICARKANGDISIEVLDTGIGIAKEDLERIFMPFTQGQSSSTRKYPGIGLGLAITAHLIKLHRGKLEVQSTVGKGSTFRFRLPCLKPSEIEKKLHKTTASTTTTPSSKSVAQIASNVKTVREKQIRIDTPCNGKWLQTIIAIDDDPVNLEILRSSLTSSTNRIISIRDGKKALEAIPKYKPDVVLLDLMMPDIDGYDICKRIRTRWNHATLPVIFITAKNQLGDLEKAFECGANDYLTKPFNPTEISARVQSQILAKRAADVIKRNERLQSEVRRRESAEKSLSLSRNLLAGILDKLPTPALGYRENGKVFYFNTASADIFFINKKDIINHDIRKIIPEEIINSIDKFSTGTKKNISFKSANSAIPLSAYFSKFSSGGEKIVALSIQKETDKKSADAVHLELESQKQRLIIIEEALNDVIQTKPFFKQDKPTKGKQKNVKFEKNTHRKALREHSVYLLNKALEYWETATQKTKIELAEESQIWNVYIDNGTYKTKTLDKYLKLNTIPNYPRYRDVIRTANFVLHNCTSVEPYESTLRTGVSKMQDLLDML